MGPRTYLCADINNAPFLRNPLSGNGEVFFLSAMRGKAELRSQNPVLIRANDGSAGVTTLTLNMTPALSHKMDTSQASSLTGLK